MSLCVRPIESGISSLTCRAPNPLGPRQRRENDDCDVIVGLYVDVCESILQSLHSRLPGGSSSVGCFGHYALVERLIDLSKKIEEVIITLLWHSLLLFRYDQVVIFVIYIPVIDNTCLKP